MASSRLLLRDLNIGNDVRVGAFHVGGINRSGCIAVVRAVGDYGIRIGRTGVEGSPVDLREASAGADVDGAINVVTRDVRRRAGDPGQGDAMNRSRSCGTGGRIGGGRSLRSAGKGQRGAVRTSNQGTVGYRKRRALSGRDDYRQR